MVELSLQFDLSFGEGPVPDPGPGLDLDSISISFAVIPGEYQSNSYSGADLGRHQRRGLCGTLPRFLGASSARGELINQTVIFLP